MEQNSLERWWRADDLLARALDLEPEERAAFLDQTCSGETTLRRQVEELLAMDAAASRFLDEPRAWPALPLSGELEDGQPADEGPLERLGRYRLLRKVGYGGMGTVFLAERADGQIHQKVALKLIRIGFESPEAIRRFQLEQKILARLEHPSIARLLDAEVTEDGRPYFVMEFIQGEPITAYGDRHTLRLEARLELFIQVCEAVSYAHRNLVVHRDLKPGNILITEAGQVKLLDFGIAKLLDPAGFDTSMTTPETEGRVMTPDYASPEQVRGQPITTATDVYQLGVLLYELLTGRRPYRLRSRVLHEIERAICELEPENPSRAVTQGVKIQPGEGTTDQIAPETLSQTRGLPMERLRRRLRGDLDTIVLKALRKEPDRRYASVGELAGDVRRHLTGHPVLARRASTLYWVSKFVRRQRVVVMATVLVVMSLIGGFVTTAWQAARARDQARRATVEATKAERINAFLQEIFSSPNSSKSGREVTVVEVLDTAAVKIETELKQEPAVAAAVHTTLGMTYQSLGLYAEAEEHFREALTLRQVFYEAAHADVYKSLYNLARLLQFRGAYREAETLYRASLALRIKLLGREHPEVAENLNDLATLVHARGGYEEAGPLYREALALRRKVLGEAHPKTIASLNNLARLHHDQGDLKAAVALHRDALTLQRRLLGEAHPEVTASLNNLTILLENPYGSDDAEALHRETVDMLKKQVGAEHPVVGLNLAKLAKLLHAKGEVEEAERLYREALQMQQQLVGSEHPDVATTMSNLAGLVREKGDHEAAEQLYRKALAMRRKVLGEAHPKVIGTLNHLANQLYERGETEEAERLYRQILASYQSIYPGGHRRTAGVLVHLGTLLSERGEPREAESLLREALALWRKLAEPGSGEMAQAESALGGCLAALGRYDEAEPLLVKGYSVLSQAYGPHHAHTHRSLERLVELYEARGKPEQAAAYRELIRQQHSAR